MAKACPAAAREFRSGPEQRRAARAFTLVELMLALGMGLALSAVLVQLLLAEGRQGAVLVRQWRERTFQRRTLDLVRDDLRRAVAIRVGSAVASPCPLAGREPVLQLSTDEGAITYTVGLPPSPIWRGRVLMRCGPAFGLDGEPSQGASQNRVVIDALVPKGFRAEIQGVGQVRLGMEQEFPLAHGGVQRLVSGVVVAAATATLGP
jgi:hypothetical protein